MMLNTTISAIDILIVCFALIALIIQWRSFEQDKLEYQTKLIEIEQLVNKLEEERQSRVLETEERMIADAENTNLTSRLYKSSRIAQGHSGVILRRQIAALALVNTYILDEFNELQEHMKGAVNEKFAKVTIGIVASAQAYENLFNETESISSAHEQAFNKIAKMRLSPEERHNKFVELNESLAEDLNAANDRFSEQLDKIVEQTGKMNEQLASAIEAMATADKAD